MYSCVHLCVWFVCVRARLFVHACVLGCICAHARVNAARSSVCVIILNCKKKKTGGLNSHGREKKKGKNVLAVA